MKYIILFLLFPFLLSSQTVTITHPDGIIVDNFGSKLTRDTIGAGLTKPKEVVPCINLIESINNLKDKNTGWKVETGWNMLTSGNNGLCEHKWISPEALIGDYNTKKFQIDNASGDMLQESRICERCYRMESKLIFLGQGDNPFIWETVLNLNNNEKKD